MAQTPSFGVEPVLQQGCRLKAFRVTGGESQHRPVPTIAHWTLLDLNVLMAQPLPEA